MPEAGGKWDIIVVGVGAVGSAVLRSASEAGARVLGIERLAPAHARGSSHGHSRIFRHAYFEHPDYVPLLRHSTARFESLERESGATLLHRCGMLVAGRDDSAVVRETLASAKQWGLPPSPYDKILVSLESALKTPEDLQKAEAAIEALVHRFTST